MVYHPAESSLFAVHPVALSNGEVAARLDRAAELLEGQAANPFRVAAYRRAAETVRGLRQPLAVLIEEDSPQALRELPGIGTSLSATITELTRTGRWELLDQLEAAATPAAVLSTVPGIGPELAQRVHARLGIASLPELAAAAGDGRLSRVPGFGPKRLRAVRETLAGRLRQTEQARFHSSAGDRPDYHLVNRPVADEPSVAELLSIDEQYRRQAAAGILPKIAPRRFNPTHASWLPILHTQREGQQFTAFFSNTARAHELGTTRDWVVIYRNDVSGRGQWTVVTSQFGPHKGQRVVRGREEE